VSLSGSVVPEEGELKALLRARFAGTVPGDSSDDRFLGLSAEESRRFRHLIAAETTPAAVLVPIIDHPDGLTVLLTERASDLRHHPGQIAFPGGRLEPGDRDAVATALRETEEEIGLERRHIEVIGYLPPHLVITGYRVTPVVAIVAPGVPLVLDPVEVASVFEVPLRHILDPANHRPRPRAIDDGQVTLYDIPYGPRNIWGATAGMLMTLYRFLLPGTELQEARHIG
jgi:8-oxo-dGTP pyrophosphatase MutT (NUDIX family)